MSAPKVELILNRESYLPGEQLIGVIQFEGTPPEEWDIEISVLWHTESSENEDSGLILIQEWSSGDQLLDVKPQQLFCVRLPGTAVTGDAELNQVRWMVRLRVRWAPDGEMYSETPFLVVLNDTCSTISQEETLEFRGQLAHRLETHFFGNAVLFFILAIFMNAVIFFLFFLAVHAFFAFPGNWAFSLFMIALCLLAFVTGGLRLVFIFVAILMAGPIRFEISRDPLVLGTSCQYLVKQRSRFRFRDLQLKLRCTEKTTYRRGNGTYVLNRELFQQTVADGQVVGEYGLFGILSIPDDVTPTYEAGDTKVEWNLDFSGSVARFLRFSDSYPVIVHRANKLPRNVDTGVYQDRNGTPCK